jgi:hypothetical protein
MNEVAEWLRDSDALADGDPSALDLRLIDIPSGLRITARSPLEQLERRGRAPAERGISSRIQGVAEEEPIGIGCRPRRAERRPVQLIQMIKHGVTSRLRICLTAKCCIQLNAASQNQMVILCCSATATCHVERIGRG